MRWTKRWRSNSGRIRSHLRRPIPRRGELLNENAKNTIKEIVSAQTFPLNVLNLLANGLADREMGITGCDCVSPYQS